MKFKVLLLLAVLFCTSVPHAGQAAEKIRIQDATIRFDAGPGMCALDKAKAEFDQRVLNWQERANAGTNKVLGIFVECNRLGRLRAGQESGLGQYGILLAVGNGKGQLAYVPNYSRARFIAKMSKTVSEGIDLDVGEMSDRMYHSLDAEMKNAVGSLKLSNYHQLGVIGRDEYAVYQGVLLKLTARETKQVVAGVAGMTLAGDHIIQYSLYEPFVGTSTVKALLETIAPVMRGLASHND